MNNTSHSLVIHDECCFCLEPLDINIFYFKCGHVLHKDCSEKIQKYSTNGWMYIKCPMCRTIHNESYISYISRLIISQNIFLKLLGVLLIIFLIWVIFDNYGLE